MRHEPETQVSDDLPGMAFTPGGFVADAERKRREGRLVEAEQALRDGLEGEPESAEGRLVLALVLLDRGLERAAQSELERLAERMLVGSGVGEISGPVSEEEIEAEEARALKAAIASFRAPGLPRAFAEWSAVAAEERERKAATKVQSTTRMRRAKAARAALKQAKDERAAAARRKAALICGILALLLASILGVVELLGSLDSGQTAGFLAFFRAPPPPRRRGWP